MALSGLLALPLLSAAAPASLPSFACAEALTPTEQAICSDAELAAWDRAIAKLYRAQRRRYGTEASDQKQWLSRRDLCGGNRACLVKAYREWPGLDSNISGVGTVYSRPDPGRRDSAGLEIMPIFNNWIYFSLTATHMQVPPYGLNDGQAWGFLELNNGRATYDEEPGKDYVCRFHLEKTRSGWVVDEFGKNTRCGGLNVWMTGDYLPLTKKHR